MSLDHGMVNLPLDKRGGGSLDAQIEREVTAEKKRKKRLFAEAKAKFMKAADEAKEALPGLLNNKAWMDAKADSLGISRRYLATMLKEMSEDHPQRLLKIAKDVKRCPSFPALYKSIDGMVVEFSSENEGVVRKSGHDQPLPIGHGSCFWIDCTDEHVWQPYTGDDIKIETNER